MKKFIKSSLFISVAGAFSSLCNYVILYLISKNETRDNLDLFFKAIAIPASFSGAIANAISFFIPTILIGLSVKDNSAYNFFRLIKKLIYINITISIFVFSLNYSFIQSVAPLYTAFAFANGALLLYYSMNTSIGYSSGNFLNVSTVGFLISFFSLIFSVILHNTIRLLEYQIIQFIFFLIAVIYLNQFIIEGKNNKTSKLSFKNNKEIYANFVCIILSLSGFTLYPLIDAFWVSYFGYKTLGIISMAQRLNTGIFTLIFVGLTTVLSTYFQGKSYDHKIKITKKLIILSIIISLLIFLSLFFLYFYFNEAINIFIPLSLSGIVPVFFLLL